MRSLTRGLPLMTQKRIGGVCQESGCGGYRPPTPSAWRGHPVRSSSGMPATRDQEVDIAYALEVVPHVVGVYALALPPSAQNHVDATPFGVVLRPYTGEALASAHFALLDASSYEVTASIAYADAALSRLFQDARRLVVEPGERDAARSRFLERSSANLHVRRLEQAAMAEASGPSKRARSGGRSDSR